MVHDGEGFSVAWWELAFVGNSIISVAYLVIAVLILVPTARSRQLWSNKLALATGLIFFSCSVGHGLHALEPLITDDPSGMMHMNVWWLAIWHTLTAGVAVYYLSLRRFYGRLLSSPLFHDQAEQERLADLEQLALANSARAEAENDRDTRAAMLQAIVQNSQSLVYVKDLDGRFIMTNPAFDRALNLGEGAMLGHSDVDLDPSRAAIWEEHDVQARGGLIEVEESNQMPDGPHVFETAKFPLRHPDGSVYAICGVSLDVTEKRMAAAQAVERDVALAANVAKSTFLATMSHEIRTPLNAVIGMTDLLLASELDDQQRECVDTVRTSGDALLALINDVLDFSKIEAGDLQLEAISLDIGAEAETSLELVLPGATRKGLELVCDVTQAGATRLLGDVHRLRQIFANLLSNAVKFTERGEILLTVTTEQVSETSMRVLARVADTGQGVREDAQDRLFRSYSQLDASTARVYGGTGLGLVISRKLAEAMGGTLTLDSTGPAGSTFLLDVVLEIAPSSQQLPVQQLTGAPQLIGKTALVVDDNLTNLRILEYQLGILGLDCASFSDPTEALQSVAAGLRYDVAVLDMHMPQMDGVTLGAGLRAMPEVSDAPLVLLTSLGGRPVGVELLFAAFLTKPAKRATLHETVLQVLQGRSTTAAQRPFEPSVCTRSLRVLLAEDNVVNQRVAKLMLEMIGHQVDTVVNGYDAVEAVTTGDYDVVLMDVQMPDVDGLEATRRIRARLPSERIPYIVAMTANALPEDRAACLAAGMDEYLSKPVRMKDLETVMAQAIATVEGSSGGGAGRDSRGDSAAEVGAAETGGAGDRSGADRGGADRGGADGGGADGGGADGGGADGGGEGSSAEAGEPAVDSRVLDALLEQLGEGSEVRAELLEQFLTEAGTQMVALQSAVDTGDEAAVKAICHTWRSTSALLGMSHLGELLNDLEHVQDSPEGPIVLTSQVEHEYHRVLLELSGQARS